MAESDLGYTVVNLKLHKAQAPGTPRFLNKGAVSVETRLANPETLRVEVTYSLENASPAELAAARDFFDDREKVEAEIYAILHGESKWGLGWVKLGKGYKVNYTVGVMGLWHSEVKARGSFVVPNHIGGRQRGGRSAGILREALAGRVRAKVTDRSADRTSYAFVEVFIDLRRATPGQKDVSAEVLASAEIREAEILDLLKGKEIFPGEKIEYLFAIAERSKTNGLPDWRFLDEGTFVVPRLWTARRTLTS
ncbi:MAG: hypothetical protein ACYCOU_00625 [Sulfobacillus sp.]